MLPLYTLWNIGKPFSKLTPKPICINLETLPSFPLRGVDGSPVYLPVLKDEWKDNPPIIGKPQFIIIEDNQPRWAEDYEVDVLVKRGPHLPDKTIFDYTRDPMILRQVLDFDPNDIESKQCYINNAHPVNTASDIARFAELIGDKELEAKAQHDYAWNSWQRVLRAGAKRGIIVD